MTFPTILTLKGASPHVHWFWSALLLLTISAAVTAAPFTRDDAASLSRSYHSGDTRSVALDTGTIGRVDLEDFFQMGRHFGADVRPDTPSSSGMYLLQRDTIVVLLLSGSGLDSAQLLVYFDSVPLQNMSSTRIDSSTVELRFQFSSAPSASAAGEFSIRIRNPSGFISPPARQGIVVFSSPESMALLTLQSRITSTYRGYLSLKEKEFLAMASSSDTRRLGLSLLRLARIHAIAAETWDSIYEYALRAESNTSAVRDYVERIGRTLDAGSVSRVLKSVSQLIAPDSWSENRLQANQIRRAWERWTDTDRRALKHSLETGRDISKALLREARDLIQDFPETGTPFQVVVDWVGDSSSLSDSRFLVTRSAVGLAKEMIRKTDSAVQTWEDVGRSLDVILHQRQASTLRGVIVDSLLASLAMIESAVMITDTLLIIEPFSNAIIETRSREIVRAMRDIRDVIRSDSFALGPVRFSVYRFLDRPLSNGLDFDELMGAYFSRDSAGRRAYSWDSFILTGLPESYHQILAEDLVIPSPNYRSSLFDSRSLRTHFSRERARFAARIATDPNDGEAHCGSALIDLGDLLIRQDSRFHDLVDQISTVNTDAFDDLKDEFFEPWGATFPARSFLELFRNLGPKPWNYYQRVFGREFWTEYGRADFDDWKRRYLLRSAGRFPLEAGEGIGKLIYEVGIEKFPAFQKAFDFGDTMGRIVSALEKARATGDTFHFTALWHHAFPSGDTLTPDSRSRIVPVILPSEAMTPLIEITRRLDRIGSFLNRDLGTDIVIPNPNFNRTLFDTADLKSHLRSERTRFQSRVSVDPRDGEAHFTVALIDMGLAWLDHERDLDAFSRAVGRMNYAIDSPVWRTMLSLGDSLPSVLDHLRAAEQNANESILVILHHDRYVGGDTLHPAAQSLTQTIFVPVSAASALHEILSLSKRVHSFFSFDSGIDLIIPSPTYRTSLFDSRALRTHLSRERVRFAARIATDSNDGEAHFAIALIDLGDLLIRQDSRFHDLANQISAVNTDDFDELKDDFFEPWGATIPARNFLELFRNLGPKPWNYYRRVFGKDFWTEYGRTDFDDWKRRYLLKSAWRFPLEAGEGLGKLIHEVGIERFPAFQKAFDFGDTMTRIVASLEKARATGDTFHLTVLWHHAFPSGDTLTPNGQSRVVPVILPSEAATPLIEITRRLDRIGSFLNRDLGTDLVIPNPNFNKALFDTIDLKAHLRSERTRFASRVSVDPKDGEAHLAVALIDMGLSYLDHANDLDTFTRAIERMNYALDSPTWRVMLRLGDSLPAILESLRSAEQYAGDTIFTVLYHERFGSADTLVPKAGSRSWIVPLPVSFAPRLADILRILNILQSLTSDSASVDIIVPNPDHKPSVFNSTQLRSHLLRERERFASMLTTNPSNAKAHAAIALLDLNELAQYRNDQWDSLYRMLVDWNIAGYFSLDTALRMSDSLAGIISHLRDAVRGIDSPLLIVYHDSFAGSDTLTLGSQSRTWPVLIDSKTLVRLADLLEELHGMDRSIMNAVSNMRDLRWFVKRLNPNLLNFAGAKTELQILRAFKAANADFLKLKTLAQDGVDGQREIRELGSRIRGVLSRIDRISGPLDDLLRRAQNISIEEIGISRKTDLLVRVTEYVARFADGIRSLKEDFDTPAFVTPIKSGRFDRLINLSQWFDTPPANLLTVLESHYDSTSADFRRLGGVLPDTASYPVARVDTTVITAARNSTVTLNAGSSSNPSGRPLVHRWIQTDGPRRLETNTPTTATLSFVVEKAGTYEIFLSVHDFYKNSSPIKITIRVP